MMFTFITDLNPREKHSVIRVRAARKWEYRGPTDSGPVQHVDLVRADEKGNVIYVEIPSSDIPRHDSKIQENGTYIISRFKVTNLKNAYRPVHARYMIEFTCYTQISVAQNPPETFPRYVYRLTEFDDLYNHLGNHTYFHDVLAIITEVAEPVWKRLSGQPDLTLTRDLTLMNLDGAELTMTLWGRKATEFDINSAPNTDNAKPLVTLFVGCLMKSFMRKEYLSGSSACKWYFHPEIPEATTFYNRLQCHHIEIKRVGTPLEQQTQPPPPPVLEVKYLQELANTDPYDFPSNGCQCTVTIAHIIPDFGWWFPSCNICSKSSTPEGSGYRCRNCNCTTYTYKLKLAFIATDGTAEAEMICFGNVASKIIGKSVHQIMASIRRGATTPPDIAAIVSEKFTFAIAITGDSYHTPKRIYLINSVIASHGKQRAILQLATNPGSSSYNPILTPTTQQVPSAPNLMISNTSSPRHAPPTHASTIEADTKDAPPLDLESPEKSSAQKRLYSDNTTTNPDRSKSSTKKSKLSEPGAHTKSSSLNPASPKSS